MSRHWPAIFRFCLLLAPISCLEPYDPPAIQQDASLLVVDGFLVPNDTTRIRLTRTNKLDTLAPYRLEDDAVVRIESESGTIYPLTEKSAGEYILPPTLMSPDDQYRLHIRTEDTHEYASDYVPLKPGGVLDSVIWREHAADERIAFSVFAHDPDNQTRYYLWTFDETWEYTSAERSQLYYDNGQILYRARSDELYYCWKTVKTNNYFIRSTEALSSDVVYDYPLFSLSQAERKLYFAYSILVSQYAITKEAYDYWTITKKNSEELGTLFDPLPSQPTGNLHALSHPGEPVIGFFSASMVSHKRTSFTRQQITGPSTPYTSTGYEGCVLKIIPPDKVNGDVLSPYLIYRKEYDMDTGEFLGYSVGTIACLDCRARGGTNHRPDYWP